MSMLGLRDLLLIAPTHPSSSPLHHQHQQQPISADHHALPSSSALSVGLGIFPLLTTTMPHSHHHHHANNNNDAAPQDCGNTNPNYFWNLKMCQQQQQQVNTSSRKGVMMMNVGGEEEEDDEIEGNKHLVMMGCEQNGVFGGGEFRVCQDCGNRAKKDCSYKRCRTCCKGRGYHCTTHVKSTWVPASLRRDRNTAAVSEGGDSDGGGGASSSGTKRLRTLVSSSQNNVAAAATSHSSTSNATTTRSLSLDTNHSCHQQDAGFKRSLPRHVRAPAVFKCHRVCAIGNGEDEIAYMATVHISGHVFQGFLYDQGVVDDDDDWKSEKMPCVSELQLGSNGSGKNNNRECSNSAIGVPTSSTYPTSAC